MFGKFMFRAVIVEDNEADVKLLREFLKAHSDVAIVGYAKSKSEAMQVIQKEKPNLLFLDVQLSGCEEPLGGFELLQDLGTRPPLLVLTSADMYAQVASKARVNYQLVKSTLDEESMADAMKLIRERWADMGIRRIAIPGKLDTLTIDPETILCVVGDGQYTKWYVEGAQNFHNPAILLKEARAKLSSDDFIYIRPSWLINHLKVARVVEKVEPAVFFHGLNEPVRLSSSEDARHLLQAMRVRGLG